MVSRTSTLTRAPDWSGWLCACLVWHSWDGEVKVAVGGQDDDLTIPDEVGDELDGLQEGRLLGIIEGHPLEILGKVS